MTFNPTHEFQGLELRYEYDYDVINGVMTSWYTTEDGFSLCLPQTRVTKFQPQPKTGEVWKYVINDDGSGFLRGVDALGRLFTLEHQDVVWDPYEHNDSTLQQYEKVLNADGTPA